MKPSVRNDAQGKLHQAKGRIKQAIGKIFGNRNLEAEGNVEILKGKVQEKIAQAEKVVGK
jgi:uncharacterized protein YjbJ (UPF0337 family)